MPTFKLAGILTEEKSFTVSIEADTEEEAKLILNNKEFEWEDLEYGDCFHYEISDVTTY